MCVVLAGRLFSIQPPKGNPNNNSNICELQLVSNLCVCCIYLLLLQAKPENVGDACSLCKTVTGFLKSFVDSNSSEPEIKTALEDFCKLFPTNISKEVPYSGYSSMV